VRLIITPSKLHQFTYCPRIPWFDYYLQYKRTLRQRVRMFIGKVLHWIHHTFKYGYEKEKLLSVDIPELDVTLLGKPDSYRIDGDVIFVEEFKSTKSPKYLNCLGLQVWECDMVQSLAYAYILKRLYGKDVIITVRYVNTSVTFNYNEKLEEILMWYIERYKKMVEFQYLPDTPRNKRCITCVYREMCDVVDAY